VMTELTSPRPTWPDKIGDSGAAPVVSVVVPVYNRQDVIGRAIQSLVAQAFDQPYEIIVVDDGSTDDSATAAVAVTPAVIVRRQQNAGPAGARRAGIEASRGRFVAFLDSDDVAEPQHLHEHWVALQRRPDAVLSFARVGDMEGRPLGENFRPEQLETDGDGVIKDPLPVFIREGCLTASMNLMTYREVALRAAADRFDVPAASDYAFALQAAAVGPFSFIPKTTIRVDRRDDGISRTRTVEQFGYGLLAIEAAVKSSARTDAAVQSVFRRRIAEAWPSAVVTAIRAQQWGLGTRLVGLGLRHGLRRDSPKRLWWALSERNI
jgi:glycosyltransferase involved in cell wall biosynthesis